MDKEECEMVKEREKQEKRENKTGTTEEETGKERDKWK